MPREVNVDELRQEGATIYTIGGHRWLAPEPDMDTLREIVLIDVQALVQAREQLKEAAMASRAAEARSAAGDAEGAAAAADAAATDITTAGDGTLAGVDTLIPQLQRLLFLCDEQGHYIRGSYVAAGDPVWPHQVQDEEAPPAPRGGTVLAGEPCDEEQRMPIPEPYARRWLSGKRAGTILAEVLGEELGRV